MKDGFLYKEVNQLDHPESRSLTEVSVFKCRKDHSPLTAPLIDGFTRVSTHTDYFRYGCFLCNRLVFVETCLFWGQHVRPLIKIRTCNGSTHTWNDQGSRHV